MKQALRYTARAYRLLLPCLLLCALCAFCACAVTENQPDSETDVCSSVSPATEQSAAVTKMSSEQPDEPDEIPEGLSFRIEDGHATVWGNKRNVKEILIPERIMGVPVTEIANGGFRNFAKMKKLTLPEGLLRIGDSAFENCYALEEVTLPESLTELGEKAFACCRSIRELTIGHRLKVLPSGCFAECNALTEIVVPEGVTELYQSFSVDHLAPEYQGVGLKVTLPRSVEKMIMGVSFGGKDAMLELYVPDVAWWYRIDSTEKNIRTYTYREDAEDPDAPWVEGTYTIINTYAKTGANTLLYADGTLVSEAYFPKGITEIPDFCWSGIASVTSAVIPESVTKIGKNAFEHTGLTFIEIPEGLTRIEDNAFSYSMIETLTVPGSVETVGRIEGMDALGILIFEEGVRCVEQISDCKALSLLILPASLTQRPVNGRGALDAYYFRSDRYKDDGTLNLPFPCTLAENCPQLRKIEVAPDNPVFTVIDGGIFYKVDPNTILREENSE